MKTWHGIGLTDLTQKLLQAYCSKTGEKPKDVLLKALLQLVGTQSTKA